MPRVSDLTESKYLKKEDFPAPRVVTVSHYDQVNMAKQGEKPDMKYVIYFKELDKPMTLNKTNGNRFAAVTRDVYGVKKYDENGSQLCEDFDQWIGKRYELFNDTSVEFGGEIIGGIRVRFPWTPKQAVKPQTAEDDFSELQEEVPF